MIKKILDILQYFVFGGVLAIILYFYVIAPHRVDGISMFPYLYNNDLIFVYKLSYAIGGEPKRGDIVVFRHNVTNNFVKRVIGVPGDTVELKEGHYYVNGQLVVESAYLADDVVTQGGETLPEGGSIVVEPGTYFVSGDNRPHSIDSRNFGLVEKRNIEGKVFMVWFPFNHAKFTLL